jgi:hypothetical protein
MENPEGKTPFGRIRREDNINTHFHEIRYDNMHWIHLTQNMDQWGVLVNKVMKLRVP